MCIHTYYKDIELYIIYIIINIYIYISIKSTKRQQLQPSAVLASFLQIGSDRLQFITCEEVWHLTRTQHVRDILQETLLHNLSVLIPVIPVIPVIWDVRVTSF